MSQPVTQSGVIPIPQAVNKYFELSLYLLVLTGFATLASTGGLDLPAVVVTGAALAIRGYLLAERRRVIISARWTTPLTIVYFAFYAADYFWFSRAFLAATVHLVLFAVVVRTFSLRRDRDYIMLAVLSFLMVLASAVLTVDSVFLFFFAGFMLLAVATFILMEMRRSGRAAKFQAQHSNDAYEHRHMAYSLARLVPTLVALILVGAALVFFLLPRMSVGYLGGYSFGTDLSTGFNDHVQLGRIGQIQQSNAVVMHIQIDGDNHGEHELHWRGVSLANFDGKNWSNPPEQHVLPPAFDGSFSVPSFGQGTAGGYLPRDRRASLNPARLIHYRVLLEPIGTNIFFLAPWARRVRGAYRGVSMDSGGAIYDLDVQHPVSIYEADSDISRPSPAELRASGSSSPDLSGPYLQLPKLDSRIPQLAAQIAASASNNYDKAAAIERYLKTHYAYTLQLPRAPVADPLANFLFERKQGHCEYFASSMAVMLRTLQIPSRVVNGFRSEEFNDVTGNYVVRAKNAHSWVEAYFPGYGWVTFDPTPGGEIATPEGWERTMLYLDAAQSFWREWIISYDSSHQYVLGKAAAGGTRSSLDRTRLWLQSRYRQMLNWARRSQQQAEHSPIHWLVWSLAAGLFLFSLANAARLARMLRARKLRNHPEDSPHEAASLWYQRMAKSLSRRGLNKSAGQTPQEFVRIIEDQTLRSKVARFTDAYEAARFGNSSDNASLLPDLFEEVELSTKK
jgi:transglutaminase-like putative cysteine protease